MKINKNKPINEGLVIDVYDLVKELLPTALFTGNRDTVSKEKAKVIVEDLIDTLNDFYRRNRIDWKVKSMKRAFEVKSNNKK
jgi:hypothetical protein